MRFNLYREDMAEDWLVKADDGWLMRVEDRDAEVKKLKEERDGWKNAAERAGVCTSCALGIPMYEQGCHDCLGTGFCGPYHNELHNVTTTTAMVHAVIIQAETKATPAKLEKALRLNRELIATLKEVLK
jgi:hypothetical protein